MKNKIYALMLLGITLIATPLPSYATSEASTEQSATTLNTRQRHRDQTYPFRYQRHRPQFPWHRRLRQPTPCEHACIYILLGAGVAAYSIATLLENALHMLDQA